MAEKTLTVLSMDFVGYDGKSVSIRLSDPREDITAQEVQSVMELLTNIKVLQKIHGENWAPAKIKGAKTIETTTSDFGIVVE